MTMTMTMIIDITIPITITITITIPITITITITIQNSIINEHKQRKQYKPIRQREHVCNSISIRPFFILRVVRPRIFESKFRNHCAKKLVCALGKPTSFI